MAKKIDVSDAVWISLVITLAGSFLATAVALPLILSDIPFFQKADRSSFFLSLPLIPLTALSTSLRLQLAGLRRFARLAYFSILQTLTNVLMLTMLVIGLKLRVEGALAATIVGHTLMIGAMIAHLYRTQGIRLSLSSRHNFREVIRYGLEYHLARLGHVVDVQIGVLFLGMVGERADIGLFALATALLTRLWILSEATASAILPRVAATGDGRPAMVSFCARATSWATGVAVACLCVISVPLTRVLFSDAFLPSVGLIWIMAPGVLVYSGTSVIMAYFRGTNRPRVCSWSVCVGFVGNLATLALLYSRLGVFAAAYGFVVGRLLRTVVVSIAFVRVSHCKPTSIWFPQQGDCVRIRDLGQKALSRVAGGRRRES